LNSTKKTIRENFLNFRLQYDPVLIPELAAKYLRTPYKRETAADADREMEEAGERLVNDPSDLESGEGNC